MTDRDPSEVSERPAQDAEARLVELVKVDYDATLRALNGFATAASAMRGIGIAVWGVIVGIAIRDESSALAVLAVGATFVFAFIDGYHSALYRGALARAVRIESLLNEYAETLGIYADDAETVDKVRARLELHAFGVNRTMRRITLPDVFDARPWPVFVVLYPVLIVTAIIVFLVYAV
jgi:hypothetical protein